MREQCTAGGLGWRGVHADMALHGERTMHGMETLHGDKIWHEMAIFNKADAALASHHSRR